MDLEEAHTRGKVKLFGKVRLQQSVMLGYCDDGPTCSNYHKYTILYSVLAAEKKCHYMVTAKLSVNVQTIALLALVLFTLTMG